MGLPTAFLSRGRPLKGPFYLRLSFLATRKRVHELLKAQLIGNLVLLQLIFNVLLDFLFVLSYRIHEVSPGPEMPIAILVLQICMSVENHETALSLEISHDIGNAVLRRKLISIWIWSGQASASMISIPFVRTTGAVSALYPF